MNMNSMLVGKCLTCGADIAYQDGQEWVKCTSCGKTHAVASFLNEQIRINKIREEKRETEEKLKKAEEEKSEAERRLYQTITSLANIETAQIEHDTLLRQLHEGQDQNRINLKSLVQLAEELQNTQDESNDFINTIYRCVIDGQDTVEDALQALNNVVTQLLSSHTDFENRSNEIVEYFKTDLKDKDKRLEELKNWMQGAHREDDQRLIRIQFVCEELIKDDKQREQQIEQLRADSKDIQEAVKEFEKHWEESELNKRVQYFRQAESYQFERKFDKAEDMYHQVVITGGKDPEVYWRIVLCHYCIEYQVDNEGNRIPSILYPDLREPSEIPARWELQNSYQTEEQRKYYTEQVEVIDRILDKYRRLCKEVQFDVFISVKQKDKGAFTADYGKGLQLHSYLTNELGLKVFNSEVTKPNVGEEFEPYILAALMSAKVLIVVGSCREYMDAQWVRNEWSRYMWLQKNENPKRDRMLFCYLVEGMKPYQMPNELIPIQVVKEDDFAAKDELVKTLKRVFGGKPQPSVQTEKQLLANWEAWLTLGKGYFDRIKEEYNQMVKRGEHLDNTKFHLLALCADYKVPSIDRLPQQVPELIFNSKFTLADRCAKNQEDRALIDNLKKDYEQDNLRKQVAKKNKVYAVLSVISAFVICMIMIMLYYVEPYADEMKRDIHVETILISGTVLVLFLSIILFRAIYRLSAKKAIEASGLTRTIGVIHLCVCLFVLIGAIFTGDNAWDGWILGRWAHYYQYYNDYLIEIYTFASSVFISTIGAILTIAQKNKYTAIV